MCCILHKCYVIRVKIFGWLPIVAEYGLAAWTYYVYVIAMCLFTSQIFVEKIILIVLYHIILFLALWSHTMAVFTKSRKPPEEFLYDERDWYKLTHDFLWIERREEMEKLRIRLGIKTAQTSVGQSLIVYCQHCKSIKPDRCHHCSKCGVCVLKMDHHCPWLNNCVGFHNYKYFLLFIFYTLLCCAYIAATSSKYVIAFVNEILEGKSIANFVNIVQITIMFTFVSLIGIALVPLIKLHWKLVHMNITTLEETRPVGMLGKSPDMRLFDVGLWENLIQTFGPRKLLWGLPLFTSVGDGVHFPLKEETLPAINKSESIQWTGQQVGAASISLSSL